MSGTLPASATGKTGMMETIEVMATPSAVSPGQRQARQAARKEIVRQMKHGATASEARRRCPVPMHRSTVYRLLKRVEREGEHALAERRHGYPIKLRGEVLTFLLDYCQNHASVASCEVQRLVAERFNLSVSVSQLNRVRAAHGLSRKNPPREKKAANGCHHCLWIS
jgi:transposase